VLVDLGGRYGGSRSGSGLAGAGAGGSSSGAELGGRSSQDERQVKSTPYDDFKTLSHFQDDDGQDLEVQIKLIDFGTALDMSLPDPRPVRSSGYSVEDQDEGDGRVEEEPGYRGRRVLQVGSG
jgi:hypothetical protein